MNNTWEVKKHHQSIYNFNARPLFRAWGCGANQVVSMSVRCRRKALNKHPRSLPSGRTDSSRASSYLILSRVGYEQGHYRMRNMPRTTLPDGKHPGIFLLRYIIRAWRNSSGMLQQNWFSRSVRKNISTVSFLCNTSMHYDKCAVAMDYRYRIFHFLMFIVSFFI